jgi:hypothetical protein
MCRRLSLLIGEGEEGGWGGGKSYREKAWLSINHWILSGTIATTHEDEDETFTKSKELIPLQKQPVKKRQNAVL